MGRILYAKRISSSGCFSPKIKDKRVLTLNDRAGWCGKRKSLDSGTPIEDIQQTPSEEGYTLVNCAICAERTLRCCIVYTLSVFIADDQIDKTLTVIRDRAAEQYAKIAELIKRSFNITVVRNLCHKFSTQSNENSHITIAKLSDGKFSVSSTCDFWFIVIHWDIIFFNLILTRVQCLSRSNSWFGNVATAMLHKSTPVKWRGEVFAQAGLKTSIGLKVRPTQPCICITLHSGYNGVLLGRVSRYQGFEYKTYQFLAKKQGFEVSDSDSGSSRR